MPKLELFTTRFSYLNIIIICIFWFGVLNTKVIKLTANFSIGKCIWKNIGILLNQLNLHVKNRYENELSKEKHSNVFIYDKILYIIWLYIASLNQKWTNGVNYSELYTCCFFLHIEERIFFVKILVEIGERDR